MNFTEIFNALQAIDCREHIEKKNDLSYLSWPWAWGYVASRYDASYEVLNDKTTELPFFEAPGMGYIVRTRVTIEGFTREMWLPAMSADNRALQATPFEITRKRRDGTPFTVTIPPCDMMDINKTIMRCLVKNLAMFGLGLGIYAGEDLPLDLTDEPAEVKKAGKGKKGQSDKNVPLTLSTSKPATEPGGVSAPAEAAVAGADAIAGNAHLTLSTSNPAPGPGTAAPAAGSTAAPGAGADDLAGTVFDDQLLIALDDLRRVNNRAALVEVYHQWAPIYYTNGTAESAKFIQEMDAKLAAYPRTSANSDK